MGPMIQTEGTDRKRKSPLIEGVLYCTGFDLYE
jgi:hypothetical protein